MSEKGKEVVAKQPAYKMESVCIIAGADLGGDRSFAAKARELGKELSSRKVNVVYGGGLNGLGAIVAASALSKGSKVLSITLAETAASSTRTKSVFPLGRELRVRTAQDRMIFKLRGSDAFIVMPGGLDNLEEFSTVMRWANYNVHRRPIGFYNVHGFFDKLLDFLAGAGVHGFIPREIHHLMVAATTAGPLIDMLQGLVRAPDPPVNPVVQTPGDKRKREEPDVDLRL